MKKLKFIFAFLLLHIMLCNPVYSAGIAEGIIEEDALNVAFRSTCQQALDIFHMRRIYRNAYCDGLLDRETQAIAFSKLCASEIENRRKDPVDPAAPAVEEMATTYLTRELSNITDFIKRIDGDWKYLEHTLENLMHRGFSEPFLRDILNRSKWSAFAIVHNIKCCMPKGGALNWLIPVDAAFARDAELIEMAYSLLLPFMSKDYQKDFKEHGLESIARKPPLPGREDKVEIPEVGIVCRDNVVQITTRKGARIQVPLESRPDLTWGPLSGSPWYCLDIRLRSGFTLSLANMDKGETESLFNGVGEEIHKFNKLQALKARRGDKGLSSAKGKTDEAAEAFEGSKAAKSKPKKRKPHEDDEEESIVVITEKPKNKKPVALAGAGAGRAVEGKEKKVVEEGLVDTSKTPLVAPIYDIVEAPRAIEVISIDVAPAAAGAGGGAGAAAGAGLITEGAGGAACVARTCADEEEMKAALLRRAERDKTLGILEIMERGKSAAMPERSYAESGDLKKRQRDTLCVLLGIPTSDGNRKEINTLKWNNLVSLLKGLGFEQDKGSIFINKANQRLLLHPLHYDDYRLNYKLVGILLSQLQYYGYSNTKLMEMFES